MAELVGSEEAWRRGLFVGCGRLGRLGRSGGGFGSYFLVIDIVWLDLSGSFRLEFFLLVLYRNSLGLRLLLHKGSLLQGDANLELRLGLGGAIELLVDGCVGGVENYIASGRVRVSFKGAGNVPW